MAENHPLVESTQQAEQNTKSSERHAAQQIQSEILNPKPLDRHIGELVENGSERKDVVVT